jgi:hypothetical protein
MFKINYTYGLYYSACQLFILGRQWSIGGTNVYNVQCQCSSNLTKLDSYMIPEHLEAFAS